MYRILAFLTMLKDSVSDFTNLIVSVLVDYS